MFSFNLNWRVKVILIGLVLNFQLEAQENKRMENTYRFYPAGYETKPDIPSPCTFENGTEVVLARLKTNVYSLVQVTVENGESRDYPKRQWGKGKQLELGCHEFPTLSESGLHSKKELRKVKFINEKSIDEITKDGQPGAFSRSGFLARNEDIISVLKEDNQLVSQMGVTHPDLARPLFHVFNLILENRKHYLIRSSEFGDIQSVFYNNKEIFLTWSGAKGWQSSIFNDDNLGYYQIKIRRDPTKTEKEYLYKQYPQLSSAQMDNLVSKLSEINTGEMVPYYIMRYGFYEGHTVYRADPLSIAFVFGLKPLPEIDKASSNKLPELFNK